MPTAILKPTPEQNKFAKFDKVTDYQTVNTYEIGGSKPEFLDFQFTHKPLVAVVEVCGVQPVSTPFGVPPPKPVCDPTSDKNGFVVLTRDLGQLRLPPILAFISSGVLFGLGLLGLHWRERRSRAGTAAGDGRSGAGPGADMRRPTVTHRVSSLVVLAVSSTVRARRSRPPPPVPSSSSTPERKTEAARSPSCCSLRSSV